MLMSPSHCSSRRTSAAALLLSSISVKVGEVNLLPGQATVAPAHYSRDMRGSAEGWSSQPQPVEGAGQNCAGTAVVEETMHAIVAAWELSSMVSAFCVWKSQQSSLGLSKAWMKMLHPAIEFFFHAPPGQGEMGF